MLDVYNNNLFVAVAKMFSQTFSTTVVTATHLCTTCRILLIKRNQQISVARLYLIGLTAAVEVGGTKMTSYFDIVMQF